MSSDSILFSATTTHFFFLFFLMLLDVQNYCWGCLATSEMHQRDKIQNEWNWRELYLVSLRDTNALKPYQFEFSTIRWNFAISFKTQSLTKSIKPAPQGHLCLPIWKMTFTCVRGLVQQGTLTYSKNIWETFSPERITAYFRLPFGVPKAAVLLHIL